jgi:carbamoyl-phosphate synthase (ammonia)
LRHIYFIDGALLNYLAQVTVVPWNYKFSELISQYDGLFLSNGPGDPIRCAETISELKKVISLEGEHVRPVFGICLGNQLLALAAGAKTVKMPFGNRGQNQPVFNTITGECYITPQNHGFAIDDSNLPKGTLVTFLLQTAS